jgi:threonyl-tRNA synthetase
VRTPHIAKEDLYNTSGHAKHYLEDMFKVHGGTSNEDFYLKPMNCPHHMELFADNAFSYRDMPIRYFEPATVYRDEKPGQLSGLTRVRNITQDDGHLFLRITQIKQEVTTVIENIKAFYTTMGMINGYEVSLSIRSEEKDKYLGTDDMWNTAE